MENKQSFDREENLRAEPLKEDDLAQVSGGHSHSRSSRYICRRCELEFPDAGTYFEHMAMVHGER